MKKNKVLGIAIVFSIIMAIIVIANEIVSTTDASTVVKSVEIKDNSIDDGKNISESYLLIDNESIYTSDKIWNQPSGYKSYIIQILNNRNEDLIFTVKYGTNSESYTVASNSSKTVISNNATAGTHKISFSTISGLVDGEISVTVFETSKS